MIEVMIWAFLGTLFVVAFWKACKVSNKIRREHGE